jgi:hypothetical protein
MSTAPILEDDRMRRAVLHCEAQRKGLREDHGVDRAKRLRPERRSHIAVPDTERQGHGLAADALDLVEMPCCGTRKAVLWRFCAC